MAGFSLGAALPVAVDPAQPNGANPGLAATVGTPPTWALIGGWVVGVILLAVLWAPARR